MTLTRQMKTWAAAALLACFGAGAGAETVLKFALAAPEQTPWGAQIKRLATAVAEESEGRLKVEPFYNAQLGSETEALSQLVRGRIEMGLFRTTIIAAQAPDIEIVRNFGMFQSNAQQACAQEEYLRAPVAAVLKDRGIHFGAWGDAGASYIMANREIDDISVLSGMTAGTTASQSSLDFWESLGAVPKAINISEMPSAASTGLINVSGLSYPFYLAAGLNKTFPVVSEYVIGRVNGIFVVSGSVYDGLAPEDQAALDRAFARFHSSDILAELDAFEDQMRQAHIASGGTVYKPDAAQVEALRAVYPPIWADIVARSGGEAQRLMDIIETAMAECPI